MCQLQLLRMCVRKLSSPLKFINMCLPRACTDSIVRPAIGWSSSIRFSFGDIDSNRVTTLPPRALLRARAARKIVSPSGILRLGLVVLRFERLGVCRYERHDLLAGIARQV